jgi:predicted Fe-S protein YdhL (DUF1289 family)
MSSEGEAEPRVESPCVGVCVIEEASGLCEGCLRTLGEIAQWGSSSVAQRRETLSEIERRRGARRLDPLAWLR